MHFEAKSFIDQLLAARDRDINEAASSMFEQEKHKFREYVNGKIDGIFDDFE